MNIKIKNNLTSVKEYAESLGTGIHAVMWELASYAPSDAPSNAGGICWILNCGGFFILMEEDSYRNVFLKAKWGNTWSSWRKIMTGDAEQ